MTMEQAGDLNRVEDDHSQPRTAGEIAGRLAVCEEPSEQNGAFAGNALPLRRMRQVAVIHNPASGQSSSRRAGEIRRIMEMLSAAGITAHEMETDGPGSATRRADEAIQLGCDAVLACGGDGTVHEVLQRLTGSRAALGVIPMGTANALAQDLGLGRSPVRALKKLLDAEPKPVPVGLIHCTNADGEQHSRYFTVAGGVGADALLMSQLDAGLKRRFGYVLYMVEAARIWMTNPFPMFRATFRTSEPERERAEDVSQILAVRIRSFGGALGQLAPGAALGNGTLRLLAFKTRSRYLYLRFLLAVLAGRQSFSGRIELLDVVSVECSHNNGSPAPVYVEADGEVLGTLPARMQVATEKLQLLIPPGARP
jgi:YegS/Rv2252/BmrU family lipid kinase